MLAIFPSDILDITSNIIVIETVRDDVRDYRSIYLRKYAKIVWGDYL